MIDLFPFALSIVFPEEGAYANTSGDAGGETKWGVARKMHPEITDEQWSTWTKQDSADLLRSQYWTAHQCGEMPWEWALAVFDGVVNQGGSVIYMAQKALVVSQDGVVGEHTLSAMEQASSGVFHEFIALRLLSYTKDKDFGTDGKGWFARVANITMQAALVPMLPENGDGDEL